MQSKKRSDAPLLYALIAPWGNLLGTTCARSSTLERRSKVHEAYTTQPTPTTRQFRRILHFQSSLHKLQVLGTAPKNNKEILQQTLVQHQRSSDTLVCNATNVVYSAMCSLREQSYIGITLPLYTIESPNIFSRAEKPPSTSVPRRAINAQRKTYLYSHSSEIRRRLAEALAIKNLYSVKIFICAYLFYCCHLPFFHLSFFILPISHS